MTRVEVYGQPKGHHIAGRASRDSERDLTIEEGRAWQVSARFYNRTKDRRGIMALVEYDSSHINSRLVVVGVHNENKMGWLNKWNELSLKHLRAETTLLRSSMPP